MGAIDRVFVRPDLPFDAWVETGTMHGDGADWLLQHCAPVGVTIDCMDWGYRREGVTTVLGDSALILADVIAPLRGRVCFWLDAHYPRLYQNTATATNLPLEAELEAIWRWQQTPGNVATVYVDDARIYGTACKSGPLPSEHQAGRIDLTHWRATHGIATWPEDEGYLILFPRAA